MENWTDFITVDPEVCHGQACITGTRVLASLILENLAAGAAFSDILNSYPSISQDDILAANAYAAALSRERITRF
jgi:uncharacterized protein (DUF433 family)